MDLSARLGMWCTLSLVQLRLSPVSCSIYLCEFCSRAGRIRSVEFLKGREHGCRCGGDDASARLPQDSSEVQYRLTL